MGKPSRNSAEPQHRAKHAPDHSRGAITRRERSNNAVKTAGSRNQKPQQFKLPLTKWDNVLLIGEGDFSFAKSLWTNYEIGHLVATSLDSIATLRQKYADIDLTLIALREQPSHTSTIMDAESDEWNGFSSDSTSSSPAHNETQKAVVVHDIDATNLSKAHKKLISSHGPFTKIFFNFPHTGGLSTDVNRQVRANQELLVAFFENAKSFLATSSNPARKQDESDSDYDSAGEVVEDPNTEVLRNGRIIVTLFEGEPYTLWNLRDLARHAGLQVFESFRFPWAAFPGYRHARTIGDITTGKDRSKEGKRKGAWRGEERDARCYILGLKDGQATGHKSRKRKRADDSDSED